MSIRNRFSTARQPQDFSGPGRTKQAFKDECDINQIMARYKKTGAITHYARYQGEYGFAPAVDFREALETVRRGGEMFSELPADVRRRFDNDPAKFLEFVQEPANAAEMADLGLREPKRDDSREDQQAAAEAATEASGSPSPAPAPAGGSSPPSGGAAQSST